MALSRIFTFGWSDNGNPLSNAVTITSEGTDDRDVTVGATTNDVEVSIAFTMAGLKAIYIAATNTVTLETNSSSAADDTFTITAGSPFVWTYTSGITTPFTADVTKFYLSNAGGSSSTVQIRVIRDATP